MSDRDVPANDACTVRLATSHDADLLQVVLDGAAQSSDSNVYGLDAEQLLGIHQVHIAFLEHVPIGCVMATTETATTIIHGLNVAVEYRGCGYASTLIRAVMSHNESPSTTRTYLTAVDPNLPSAQERFRKLGFAPIDEVRYDLTLMIRHSDPAGEAQSASPITVRQKHPVAA